MSETVQSKSIVVEEEKKEMIVLKLKNPQDVKWKEDVVDNEH